MCSGSSGRAPRLGLNTACPRLSTRHCCTASLFAQLLQPPSPCSLASLPQETEIAPVIADYWERAEFPFPLVPGFQVRCWAVAAELRNAGYRSPHPPYRLLLPAVHLCAQKLGIGGGNLKGYGCQGLSIVGAGMAAIELVRPGPVTAQPVPWLEQKSLARQVSAVALPSSCWRRPHPLARPCPPLPPLHTGPCGRLMLHLLPGALLPGHAHG